MLLEYDGVDFKGWQLQPGVRTVQGELEKALADLLGEPVRTVAAGRTDAGVHALGQVVNFKTSHRIPVAEVTPALNARLPSDLLILDAAEVEASFDARRSASSRRYLYRIEFQRRAVGRGFAWVVPYRLDLCAMQAAALLLPGSRDFTSFCIAALEREHRLCNLTECRWETSEHGLRLWMEANRFVRGMVRSTVGTLVDVGRGARRPEDVDAILKACDRSAAGPTAPPQGLLLHSVSYTPHTASDIRNSNTCDPDSTK